MMRATLEGTAPWSFATLEWDADFLRELIEPSDSRAPSLVDSLTANYVEMGDLLVIDEFRRLRENLDRGVIDVDIWTYDGTLRAAVDAIRA
jgi:hypothetical protein